MDTPTEKARSAKGKKVFSYVAGVLVAYGLLIHGPYTRGWVLIPMHQAASRGNVTWLKVLLNLGAWIEAPDRDGVSPLLRAIQTNEDEAAFFLLERGANPNRQSKDMNNPFMEAVSKGKQKLAEAMLAKGADVNIRDFAKGTPLLMAVITEDEAMVKLLLDHGAKVHIKEQSGEDPLDYARKEKLGGIVKLLEEATGVLPKVRVDLPGPDFGGGKKKVGIP